MIFVTLNTIIEDLLKVIRGSIINSSDPISKRQVEDWVHQYRAELIRQDMVKGYYPNPDYIQEIPFLALEDSAWADYWQTVKELPKTLDIRFKSGITWVGDTHRNEYTLVPSHRLVWQQYKRYTPNDRLAALENSKLLISKKPFPVDEITVRGIFENPMEVARFANPTIEEPLPNIDFPYPIPNSKIPTLKEMILKNELKIEVSAPVDTTNDSKYNPKPAS